MDLDHSPSKVQRAEHQLNLIASLNNCDGFKFYLKPLLEGKIDLLEKEILNGGCSSNEQYKAKCEVVDLLKNQILGCIQRDVSHYVETIKASKL